MDANAFSALQEAATRLGRQMLARLPDPEHTGFGELMRRLAQAPERLQAAQQRYYRDCLALWAAVTKATQTAEENAADDHDPRFAAPEWRSLPFFRFLRQSYALNERWLRDLVALADLPEPTLRRVDFALGQVLAAMSPSNFAATNPDAIRTAIESHGRSLQLGLRNLEHDLNAGDITRSLPGAFEVGGNIAVTPGAVVHENEVAQLIHYAPQTGSVLRDPLLIVPPFINKYYILDLQPHNSFVRYALAQGMQVFLVSWRNPTDPLTRSTWDDYVAHGVHEMMDAALEVARTRRLHALGFCVGGTLLTTALAVSPKPERTRSLTLFATLLDFGEAGEIVNYIDQSYVRQCERAYAQGGLVGGAQIANSFASLRPNELVWSFVVRNYLKGESPRPFDLLHWNADSTNAPGPLFAWYLRNAYLENRLIRPGATTVLGHPLDLSTLALPTFVLATKEDHIVPWRSAYRSARQLRGNVEFVLGASGHIAGVVNPPASGRRHYWVNPALPAQPDEWLASATRTPGSWWPHWAQWIVRQSSARKQAVKKLGSKQHPVIEPAPGRYVRTPAGVATPAPGGNAPAEPTGP